ncbi:hypothetical protein MLD38_030633 [Melastoma candidum]|uniref:Uncharacterized protein n=1 Tax=Melastoma candidum TaxID=119954 RepID=A0ACB9MQU5_9MYRT|nr:hypothetical protein MLD38_030633 [Melastoma candidum]
MPSGRGLITNWCPQVKVLSHRSVGLFVTHAGWNSMMESVSGGVPVLCWPIFAEQPSNARMACTEWGIGEEIPHEVKRGQFARLVKDMMAGEKRARKEKAAEWEVKAKEATKVGGSSYSSLDALIHDVLTTRMID